MENYLYPTHPVRCTINGPSSSGKSVFLAIFFLNIINEYDKTHIYSASLHQDIHQKLNKCFINYIPIHKFSNILKEEIIDLVIGELVNNRDFEKSDCEIETNESIEELNFLKNLEMEY